MKSQTTLDLSGTWHLSLSEQKPETFEHTIQLPGSLQVQGFGDDVDVDTPWTGQIVDKSWFESERYAPYRQPNSIKIPFWLQPGKVFKGPAWYQRDIEIPGAWKDKRITLFLERPHVETTVWLDGVRIGTENSLSVAHVYDFGVNLEPGRHCLTICVDNRLSVDVGCNSHSVSDHTQTNWNGIIGSLELRAGPPVWIDDAQAWPDVAQKSIRLKVAIGNATGKPGGGTLSVGEKSLPVEWNETGGRVELGVPLGDDAELWDEFHPCLHHLTLRVGEDQKTVTFGLREVGTRGTQITVNGRLVFLRGTLECCVFPQTGYPAMDLVEWKRILGLIKDYGFNHVRFHTWCPPEAAFEAADQLGLYLQVECASWANTSTTLGEGGPIDGWLYEEGRRILRAYGNHPSFLLMAYGNEPGKDRDKFTSYLRRWVAYWKREDPRRLHTTAAGWPAVPENHFHNIPEPRIHHWGGGLNSRLNKLPPATTVDYRAFTTDVPGSEILRDLEESGSWNIAALENLRPIISHEIGQWCVYPDFTEIPKYTGLLKARNFEIFKETLEANHMGDQATDFVQASGKLQIICYREDFESALRTKGFGGYQALQMNDFPGQGTALVGWMNPFWESKGYTTAEQFRRFNGPTVLLARLERRTFTVDMPLRVDLEIAHFGPAPLENVRPCWRLERADGGVLRSGEFPGRDIPIGNGTILGSLSLSLRDLAAPAKYRFIVSLAGTSCENDWELWLYPAQEAGQAEGNIRIVRDWETLGRMVREDVERRILFFPPAGTAGHDVRLGFSSIFWNTAWTLGQDPHTLGILCDPAHPCLAEFPTESHSNWQWWELIHGASTLCVDRLSPEWRPIVQVIDDWFTNRRLGLLFEARCGNCSLLLSGVNVDNVPEDRPALRQFRRSLLNYMGNDAFRPNTELFPEDLERLKMQGGRD